MATCGQEVTGMIFAETVSVIKDIIIGLSAIAVAWFAWLGLKTWRKELTGKARFETARNMMRAAFKLKGDFEWARNPLTRSFEWEDRQKKSEESLEESEVLNNWHAKIQRLNSVVESLNKIIELGWEAKVLVDEAQEQTIDEAVKSLKESYADLSSATAEYFDGRLQEVRSGELLRDREFMKEMNHKIYHAGEDEFSKKVNEAVEKLSSALKQYVK